MDETTYYRHAQAAFARVEAALEGLDAEVVDFDRAGDVLTMSFPGGARCVLNTQRPTRQLWLAADAQAWHFSFDPPSKSWIDDRGAALELFARVAQIVSRHAGRTVHV